MKTAKRIFAVILLAVILWAVGYLVFTGRRLPSVFTERDMEDAIITEITTETYEGSVTNGERKTETTTETTETTCGS